VTTTSTIANTTVPFVSALSELLTRHVQQQPDRIAVGTSDLQTTITYRQLDTLVRSAMAQLSRMGLKRGNTVALLSDNSVDFVLGLLAIMFSGARVAPLNPALTSNELSTRLSQLSAKGLLVTGHLANKPGFANSLPTGLSYWIMDLEGSGSSAEVRIVDKQGRTPAPAATTEPNILIGGDHIALLMFTGGTTGLPKLVPLTHHNIVASIENISSGYALSPSDTTLLVMPLFHGHGLIGGLLSTLASGGSAYVPSTGAFSAHLFWPDVVRLGVTWYTAVPTIHRILLNRASHEYPVSSPVPLRFIRSCSAPLDEELAAATTATFGAPMISAYGMTETSHQLSSTPLPVNGINKTSSVGLATGLEIRIVDEGGRDVPSGGLGEIWVRGARVTPGYLDNPEANSVSFVDGWFRSGDLGNKDEDGYIFVRGRLKEMINHGGEKISPRDIDVALLSHPKVLEAASFGEADTIYGEDVEAAVILRPGMPATESELQDYCRTRLSAFEVPQRIHIVADFPRTAKGSTDRHALALQFAASESTVSGSRRARA
jgi:acyl-CoA synthetase (AMP-forming)/AMP-acid ligase II